MRRREFIAGMGSAAAWPLASSAQQHERKWRVGVLMTQVEDDPLVQARFRAFVLGLRQLGWTEERNVEIDVRWGAPDPERFRRDAAELVALKPDVMLAASGATMPAIMQATRTIPVVFVLVPDPVGSGFVESLARPGGNASGFTQFEFGMSGKWLELLKEIAPRVTRAAILRDPIDPAGMGQFGAIQTAAPSVGVEVRPMDVRDPAGIERNMKTFASTANSGLVVTGSAPAAANRNRSLSIWVFRERRRPCRLWPRLDRSISPRSFLRRPHPQGRKAGRTSSAGADQV
jgi:putative tryptophan/tyrosine transport system substrate-binding protein